jgi:hypothetical protein
MYRLWSIGEQCWLCGHATADLQRAMRWLVGGNGLALYRDVPGRFGQLVAVSEDQRHLPYAATAEGGAA